jgi:hypothetical protein
MLTHDAAPRCFAATDLPELKAELAEVEERLRAFARRVQAANTRRPKANGFYSPRLALIGQPLGGWLERVKTIIETEGWNVTCSARSQESQGETVL